MIAMTLHEIALAVGGRVDGDADVVVSAPAFVDSRSVVPGGLFVAIAGERVDGHEYAANAVADGAAAVLGARPTGVPTVLVDDPVVALGLLARHVVDELAPGLSVYAVTGSQGKTGTKDYLAQILARTGETVATRGNLNNEIGVPLTVLQANRSTRHLVVEMGARGIGHIGYLCSLARPQVAAVINVGTAHVGEFGSREAIAQAKGEIIEALGPEGVAVLNAADDLTAAMAPRTAARVDWFEGSASPDGDVRTGNRTGWREVGFDDLGRPHGLLTHVAGGRQWSASVRLRQLGEHQLANAAAAAAMALAAGIDIEEVAEGLRRATSLSPWRMELHETADGTVVVNDAYNASPASMLAALDVLHRIGRNRASRTVAVLGPMRELGEESALAHRQVGRAAAEGGLGVLLVVGDEDGALAAGAREAAGATEVVEVAGRAQAVEWLRDNGASGDVVLVKASRASALEKVAAALLDEEKKA